MNKTLWVKLSVDYMNDPKVITAGPLGELLFVRALAYAKKNNNPYLAEAVVPRLCVGLETNPKELASTLVTVGLWHLDDNGYRIAAWDTWQANDTSGQSAGGSLAMHNRWHKHTRSSTCVHCQDGAADDKTTTSKEPKNAMMYLPEVTDACALLADLMVKNGARKPSINDGWLSEMERLNRIDGRDWDEIHKVIRWCQQDSFWRTNILSPSKLRKQYDQLKLKMAAPVRRDTNEVEQAWLEVQTQVRNVGWTGTPEFTTDRIRTAVRSIGWRNICQAQPEIMKRQFMTTYNTANSTD